MRLGRATLFLTPFIIAFIAGCVESTDVTSTVKLLPVVDEFLKQHPNAEIKILFLTNETVKQQDEINKICEGNLLIKSYWKAEITEGNDFIVVFLDVNNLIPVCISKTKLTEGGEITTNLPVGQPSTTKEQENESSEIELSNAQCSDNVASFVVKNIGTKSIDTDEISVTRIDGRLDAKWNKEEIKVGESATLTDYGCVKTNATACVYKIIFPSSKSFTVTVKCGENPISDKTTCTPNWSCASWSSCDATYSGVCSNSATGSQTRTCTDLNNCGTTSGKPVESQSCTVTRNIDGTACTTTNGTSGTCQSGTCVDATLTCTNECNTSGTVQCSGTNGYQTCGNYDSDSCSEWSSVATCPSGQTCSGGNCVSSTNETNVTSNATLSFSKIASLNASRTVLTPGVDFDNDGKKEFIFTDFWTSSSTSTAFNTYEASSNNNFVSVSRLLTESGSLVSYYPADAGDSDNDGKKELLTYGRSDNNFYTRVYEASANNTYPSANVWQTATGWWTVGARIDDLDNDGKKEISFAGQDFNYEHKVHVFENTGDNTYTEIYSTVVPNIHTSQCFNTMSDLDGDGKKEMVYGGLVSGSSWLHMYENTGDNSFAEIWSYELKYSDGNPLNCAKVIFAGDMDSDSKKEFIVGGLRSAPLGTPVITVYYIFEANGVNSFQKIAEITKSMDLLGDTSTNVADLDSDGRNEIIISAEHLYNDINPFGDGIYVYKNTGNNQFSEAWNHTWTRPGTVAQWLDSIGVGDYDGDGKKEMIFNEYTSTVNTVVYEKTS